MKGEETFKPHRPIKVLYDDDYYAAFDKPAGLLAIPSPKREQHTLLSLVNTPAAASSHPKIAIEPQLQFLPGGPLEKISRRFFLSSGVKPFGFQGGRLHPCHRLDRDTSGVILFAKGKKNQKIMMEAFRQKKVRKIYIAFVHGRLKNRSGEIKSRIRDFDPSRFRRWLPPPYKSLRDSTGPALYQNGTGQAPWAVTRYRVIETKKDFSILEVTPVTGRTNQIRIHFSQLGHPLVGERKYAFGKDYALKFRRTALHALSLSFIHPVFKKEIRIHSPLPEDMEQFRLRTLS